MTAPIEEKIYTAGIIIIGNEILSGRTQDCNTQIIALALGEIGIKLIQVRVVADIAQEIINVVQKFSNRYDYVFTTGGIGPTHDDITAESIAAAFGVSYEMNQEALAMLTAGYAKRGRVMHEAAKKMAFIPKGAKLIKSSSDAPGFNIKNVYVFAGIPEIMKSMLAVVLPQLKGGSVIKTEYIDVALGESIIAEGLGQLQKQFPAVDMGSYPYKKMENNNIVHCTSLVLRSSNAIELKSAFAALQNFVDSKL